MNILELFSGTGSVGKLCEEFGHNVISVDIEFEATHKTDIMKFDYKQYPKNYFDIIWASPPCTHYSHLQKSWLGRKRRDGIIVTNEWIEKKCQESDMLVKRVLDIIEYFNPELWFMENPQSGTLKNRDIVKGLNYYDVDYCMYSNWGYRKRTRIWTNKENFNNKLCDGKGTCGNMIEKIHKSKCGNTERNKRVSSHLKDCSIGATLHERYRIPPNLVYSLLIE